MNGKYILTKKNTLYPILFGAGVSIASNAFMPKHVQSIYENYMVQGMVSTVLLLGGWACITRRKDDLQYYRSVNSDTPELRRRLAQRHRTIGIAGWAFTIVGAVSLIQLLSRIFPR
ncbi:MAG: hypothetical protein ABI273_14475 [Lacunisphaera sp.]